MSEQVPRVALIGAGTLIVFTILSAAAARLTGITRDPPVSRPLMSRDLRFEDRPNGSIAVFDAHVAAPIDTVAPETNGFIRASLRGLANKRKFAGIDDRVFHLTAWADGRLTIDDPVSGGLVELEAFGHTNEEAFARLLTLGRPGIARADSKRSDLGRADLGKPAR